MLVLLVLGLVPSSAWTATLSSRAVDENTIQACPPECRRKAPTNGVNYNSFLSVTGQHVSNMLPKLTPNTKVYDIIVDATEKRREVELSPMQIVVRLVWLSPKMKSSFSWSLLWSNPSDWKIWLPNARGAGYQDTKALWDMERLDMANDICCDLDEAVGFMRGKSATQEKSATADFANVRVMKPSEAFAKQVGIPYGSAYYIFRRAHRDSSGKAVDARTGTVTDFEAPMQEIFPPWVQASNPFNPRRERPRRPLWEVKRQKNAG